MANLTYEAQKDNASQSIPETSTSGNTAENWKEKAKEGGITLLYNSDGEVIGQRYNNKSNQLTDEGYIEIGVDSNVIKVKSEDSTTGNIIIDYQVPPQVTTDAGTTYKAGSTSIYADYNDFVRAVLSTTGLDVDMGEIEAETYNRIFEAAQNYLTGADGQTAYSRQKILMDMRIDEDGEPRYFMSGDTALHILKAAADAGLYGFGAIMEDDPEFKAHMRTAEVGSFIGLTGNDFIYDYDEAELAALLFSKAAVFTQIYATYHEEETRHIPGSYEDYTYNSTLLTEYLRNIMARENNVNPNAWAVSLWETVTGYGNTYCQLRSIHAGTGNQVQIIENYPQYGYAVVDKHNMTGVIVGRAYIYEPTNNNYIKKLWQADDTWGGVLAGYDNIEKYMVVYDSEAFSNYLALQEAGDRQHPLYPIIVSNCVVRQTSVPGVTPRADVLKLEPGMSTTDIESAISIKYPDWEENTYTVNEYYPEGDTTVTNKYYPISINIDVDPRSGDPDPEPTPTPIRETKIDPIPVPTLDWDDIQIGHKLYTIYRPTDTEVNTLGQILWDPNIMQMIRNIFQDPMDGVISFHDLYLNPEVDEPRQLYMGSVEMKYGTDPFKIQTISNRFITCEYGELIIPNYYGDARDVDSTAVSLYIPFSGWHELRPVDVMGKAVQLTIRCDVCTGDFLATLLVKNVTTNGSSQYSPMYHFDGNCAVQTPLTSADRSRMIVGAFSTGMSLISGNVGAAALSAVGTMHNAVNINRGNGFKMNAGALTNYKTPFIMVHRPVPADPDNYNELYGYPASIRTTLRNCSGYTKVQDVHVDISGATDTERDMIETLLKGGVII